MPPQKPSVEKLRDVARKLMTTWAAEFPADFPQFKAESSQVAEVLKFLVSTGMLDAAKIGIGPAQVEAITLAIKLLQERLGGAIDRDGFIGRATIRALERRLRGCEENAAAGRELGERSKGRIYNAGREDGVTGIICYCVDASVLEMVLAQDVHSLDLVRYAWNLWTRHGNIVTRLVKDPDDANVVIRLGSLDGGGPMLGLANLGGPSRLDQQLTLTMDRSETWTPKLFTAALCHEMGHILGLTHSSGEGQLMSAVLDVDHGPATPQDEDRSRIVEVWGPRPEFDGPLQFPPPDFPGRSELDALDQDT